MSELKSAYAKGYRTGLANRWPTHIPVGASDKVVPVVIVAAKQLRDAADDICATLSDNDEFVARLGPAIDALDQAITEYNLRILEHGEPTQ